MLVLVYGREKYGSAPNRSVFTAFRHRAFKDWPEEWKPDTDFVSGHDYDVADIEVTHWMPLPDPPTEGGE